jgi:hypothetical protein
MSDAIQDAQGTQERQKSPLQHGRERDELITDIQGPFWATLLVQMGLFPNYKKAAARIRKLFKKREIFFLGKCQVRPPERDSFIYGNRRVKEDTLASHEVPLSLMLARYYPYASQVLRLYDVDAALRPDATMVIGGTTFHWEYHTGTEGMPQVRSRLALYENTEGILLFVPRKESQIAKIHPIAEAVADKVFFACLQDVLQMKTPWDKVWWSYAGERKGITQPGEELGVIPR